MPKSLYNIPVMARMYYQNGELLKNKEQEIVSWGKKFRTGIKFIDEQHRELVTLTNNLYRACLAGDGRLDLVFKECMSAMVDYVGYHFNAESEFLEKINYPEHKEHKSQHDTLIKEILTAVSEYNSGKKYTPNVFVRTLRDWVFSHIAYQDKAFALYAAEKGIKE